MIFLSDRATAALEEMLVANDAESEQGLRLVPSAPGRIGLTIDSPHEGDEVIEGVRGPLLIVDSSLAEDLDGAEIDCETKMVGDQPMTQFTLLRAA